MGVRLYHPHIGRFLQPDPVDGGSATAYDYCTADPINCTDLDGRLFGIKLPSLSTVVSVVKKAAAVVAPIAAMASIIPGPIGAAAAGISAAAYAVNGNLKQAAIMAATAAAAFVGAGAVGAAAVLAVKAVAKVAARVVPKITKALGPSNRLLKITSTSMLGVRAFKSRIVGAGSRLFGNKTMNAAGVQGLFNRAGSFVRVGWSVVGAKKFIGVSAARSVFRVAVGKKHLDLFYGPWAPW
jgi:hypothetical protein